LLKDRSSDGMVARRLLLVSTIGEDEKQV